MSKKPKKKQASAKANKARSASAPEAAKPKDGLSSGAKVALTVFAVLMALSMMLPSIAAIVGTSSSSSSDAQSQDSSSSDGSSDSADASSDSATDAVTQADEKYQPLVTSLEQKLSSDSENLATLLNLGKDYMAWGVTVRYSGTTDDATSHANDLLEKAVSYYDQYLALKDSGAVRVDRALCLFYEDMTSEATTALEQLTQDMPDYGPAWANLGMLYESAGNTDAAKDAYEHAQEADADDEYGAKTYATQRLSALESAANSDSSSTTGSTSTSTSTSTTSSSSTGVKGLSDTLANLSGTSL